MQWLDRFQKFPIDHFHPTTTWIHWCHTSNVVWPLLFVNTHLQPWTFSVCWVAAHWAVGPIPSWSSPERPDHQSTFQESPNVFQENPASLYLTLYLEKLQSCTFVPLHLVSICDPKVRDGNASSCSHHLWNSWNEPAQQVGAVYVDWSTQGKRKRK